LGNVLEEKLPSFSYSKVSSFYNCRLGYYKNYVLHERTLLSSGLSEFGTFCHLILEKYARGELQIYELLQYYQDNFFKEIPSSFEISITPTFRKNLFNNYYNDGLNYFTNFEGFKDIKVLEAEYGFCVPILNRFTFNGKIDLIAEDEDGELIVIDHKSKNGFRSKAEQAKYARQLYLYAYAVAIKYGKLPKTLKFNMFRKNQWVTIPFNQQDYEDALRWLITSVNEILAVDWENFRCEETSDFILSLDNPILTTNVACYNTDTKELKFGDNYSTFDELPSSGDDFFGRNLCSFRNQCNYCLTK